MRQQQKEALTDNTFISSSYLLATHRHTDTQILPLVLFLPLRLQSLIQVFDDTFSSSLRAFLSQGLGRHLQQALTTGIVYQIYCSKMFGIQISGGGGGGGGSGGGGGGGALFTRLLEALPTPSESELAEAYSADSRRHGALLASTSPFNAEQHSTLLSDLVRAGTAGGLDLLLVRNVNLCYLEEHRCCVPPPPSTHTDHHPSTGRSEHPISVLS